MALKAAVIFDSRTGHTARAAEFIAEGLRSAGNIEVRTFNITEVDVAFVRASGLVILGTPTYMASLTARMKTWLEEKAPGLGLAGKLGGVFATEQYIHGGADLAMEVLITHELVFGMMVYSGGGSVGKPVIHVGPVGMSPHIEEYQELFELYGQRMGKRLLALHNA